MDPKIHYCIHKCPLPVPILSQINQVIILSSTPGSSKMYPSFRFPTKTLYTPLLSPTCYMSCPSQSSWFDHPNNIRLGIQSTKHFVMWPAPHPCYLVPSRPKYPPQHPIFENPQPTFLPQCEQPIFTPIKSNRKNYISLCLNLYIGIVNWKMKDSASVCS